MEDSSLASFVEISDYSPEELLREFSGLVHSLMYKMSVTQQFWQDAEQDGILALLKAQASYDPDKAAFSTHAWHKIRKAISESIWKQQYSFGYCASSYANFSKAGELGKCTYNPDIHHREEIKDDLDEEDHAKLVRLFCEKCQRRFPKEEVDLITDYFLHGLKYGSLLKRHGNVTKRIRTLDLQPIFDEVKAEFFT
jgi:hypothetical protein